MDRIEMLKQYIEEDPSDAFVKYALALEYVKVSDDKQAKLLFEKLFTDHREYLPAYYHYGQLLSRNGAKELACNIYKEGIKLALHQRDHHTLSELRTALEITED